MRIAIVTETYPPEVNGVALTVAGLAHGLGKAGHRVQMIRPRQAGAPANDTDVAQTVLTRAMRLPLYPDLRIGLTSARRLCTLWTSEPPDAIYVATEGPLGASALRAARMLAIPAATGFHTRFDDFARHYGLGVIAPAVFAYLRRFHRRAQATLVPTAELREFLHHCGFGNVLMLRRAVNTKLFDPRRRDARLRADWGLAADQPAVLHVGRIAPEKNLALAVRAFHAIREVRPDAKFIWVGDGPARAALQRQNPDFHFAGMQHSDALARHYASGDLFLFPSLTETFGNVTLEALASGLPTVAFDYGAAREHLSDDCGRRVPFGNADAFVVAARELARQLEHGGMDEAEINQVGTNQAGTSRAGAMRMAARAAVAALDPQNVAANFAALLADLAHPAANDGNPSLFVNRSAP
jgi:glycosyltransferase involved in cell wall biosynthesis